MSDNNRHLQKLVIRSFANKDFTGEDTDRLFTTPINPDTFTKNFKVELDSRRGHGNNGTDVRFKSTVPEEMKLEFVLDGTGTMEGYVDQYKKMTVHDQLQKFLDCAYDFDGDIHRPRFLIVFWGSEINFRCVLSNLDINYTLFNPNGTPLRVKITATFLNYKAREERLAEERRSSPDLTHYRKVKQGDRLDLLTFSIYNDPKYLMQVAKANQLSTIRKVKPGTELYFPPFDKNKT
ncbi:MAG: LysM peptidoglycan-binding domain-containing protein [Chitinophagaceae bacterium]|nr:LysM peptidoglycan-binding domain-containing protein [Chitinophagaceae bacterium]